MTRRTRFALLSVCALAALPTIASADTVTFKDGSTLNGTIDSLAGGKLSVKGTEAGDVTVDMKNVRTFSTDHPILIKLKDGSTLTAPVSAAGAGDILAAPATEPAADHEIALAQVDVINPPPPKWTGSFTLAGSISDGTSQAQSLDIAAIASRPMFGDDKLKLSGEYFYTHTRDNTTGIWTTSADNMKLFGEYDHYCDKISKDLFVYIQTRIERDRIADLDLRLTPGIGLGYNFINEDAFHVEGEAGANYVYEKYSNTSDDSHAALRAAYHIDKKLNKDVAVFHDLEYLPGLDSINNYNINVDAGINATVYKNFITTLKLEYQFDSTPAPGTRHYELDVLAGIGWTF